MKKSLFISGLSLFVGICTLALTAATAESQGKGKGKHHLDAKGKHGREAGRLPFGLETLMDKKGELPSGLQKKKDEGGSLTRGLEEGGKNLTATGKGKKGSK